MVVVEKGLSCRYLDSSRQALLVGDELDFV